MSKTTLQADTQLSQVRILEASAGSGKTYALARRYVQLLMEPHLAPEQVPLNTILAITFTNKAAMEMKIRILEFLKKIALGAFDSPQEKEGILSSLGAAPQAAQKKAYIIMDYLMRNYNFFQVQTIDSFINAILSGCAFKVGLSANFKTEREHERYLAYSLDRLIDEAGSNAHVLKLFHNFLRHYVYIENRTSWLPKKDILEILVSLFSKSNRHAGNFTPSGIDAKELLFCKNRIIVLMRELRDKLPKGTDKRFENSLSAFLDEKSQAFDADALSDFFKREAFPINKGNVLLPEIERLWSDLRAQISRLCVMESETLFDYYIEIFNKVMLEMKSASSKDDVLFLEALNKEAYSLFSEKAILLPELYYRLACRFRHFLIDEFQDTSRLQWENLFIMIEEALSTGGSLFYVGDKKQAIYRFRGGDVSLIGLVKRSFEGYKLTEEPLNVNYRSLGEIVRFNNEVFSRDNLERFLSEVSRVRKEAQFDSSDVNEINAVFSGLPQSYRRDKEGGYVSVEFIEQRDKEELNQELRQKTIGLVQGLRQRLPSKDIALIVRKNEEVQQVTSWLLEMDIPVESEKTLNIKYNPYIKEIISFLRFLNSPIDDLAFSSFVLGEIFARNSGITTQKIQDFLFTACNEGNKTYLYKKFRDSFADVWEALFAGFFKSAGFVPLYELVVNIFEKFDIMRAFCGYQGFFMRLLELIKEQEEETTGLGSFLDFFDEAKEEELYVNVTESESVKVLTIHKSKGLEFAAVIIPFLEMNVRMDNEYAQESDNARLNLLRVKRRYGDFSDSLAKIINREYLKSFIDELNSIYVAFTRASRELYVFTYPRSENSSNLACLLFPETNIVRGQVSAQKNARPKAAPSTVEIPPSQYKELASLLKDQFQEARALKRRKSILSGEIAHCALSFIGNLYGKDKQESMHDALLRAKAVFPQAGHYEDTRLMLERILQDKRLAPFFEIEDGEVYLEKEVLDSAGNTRRLDRLIVKTKEALVIDYKSTSDDAPTHRAQLCEYMMAVRQIYPQKKVKGFLIYLNELTVEEISG